YHDGGITQAIGMVQRLLSFEPDNIFALANLVRFLCETGKLEEARGHAERLKAHQASTKDVAIKQAESFAWLGDNARDLEVAERGRHLAGMDDPYDDALLLHLAAVAAYRQGREQEARGY